MTISHAIHPPPSPTAHTGLPESIRAYLAIYAGRARRIELVRTLGLAAALAFFWTLLWCIVDRFQPLPAWTRGLLLGMEIVALVLIFLRLGATVERKISWPAVAAAVERRQRGFGQRLETVASQTLMPAGVRGSSDMVDRLIADVSRELDDHPPQKLLPWAGAINPWFIAVGFAIAFIFFLRISWLDLPRLLVRFTLPMAQVAPATTARITLESPKSFDVVEGQPLAIAIRTQRISPDEAVRIHVSSDGEVFASALMTSEAAGRFVYAIPSVDHDLSFYITGGDATTIVKDIHVLQSPVVKKFLVHYAYPPYIARAPLSVTSNDGALEAPAGTKATIRVIASQPLSTGSLKAGQQTLPMLPAGDAFTREATLEIRSDQTFDLQLTSDRAVSAYVPAAISVRSVPDRAPLVRILEPSGDLRLHPRDILALAYQSLDDYAVTRLALAVQINAKPAGVEIPLPIAGDPRRVESTYELDLSPLNPKIGDVLSAQLTAEDAAAQKSTSDLRHVLISPRSIDLAAHVRLSELQQSADYSAGLLDALESAVKAIDESRAGNSAAFPRINQQLSGAAEAASLLRQSLLSGIVHSDSPELSTTLCALLDAQTFTAAATEQAGSQLSGDAASLALAHERLARCIDKAKPLRTALATIADGEQAAVLIADRTNLRAAEKTAPTEPDAVARLKQALDRARADIAASAAALGLEPAAADLDDQLRAKRDAARNLLISQTSLDWNEPAKAWSVALGDPTQPESFLALRLEAAAGAEALRPDADLVYARDLQLCAQAGKMIEAAVASEPLTASTRPSAAEPKASFTPALAAIQAEHHLNRNPNDTRPPDETKAILTASADGRVKMRRWAAQPDLLTAATGRSHHRDQLALEASAEMARRNYDAAAQLDRQVAPTTQSQSPASDLSRSIEAAKRVDSISATQRSVAAETEAANPELAPQLAQRQRQVASEIEKAQQDPINGASPGASKDRASREEAMNAIGRVQELLAALPQRLTDARQSADALRQAQQRLTDAQKQAAAPASAPAIAPATVPTTAPAAAPTTVATTAPTTTAVAATAPATAPAAAVLQRLVEQSQAAVAQAQQKSQEAIVPLATQPFQSLAQDLRRYSPDLVQAADAIDQRLVPSLEGFARDVTSPDAQVFARSDADLRQATNQLQDELRKALGILIERDPLVAAKWYAQAAAVALEQKPADFPRARAQQGGAARALDRAWGNIVRQAAANRLAGTAMGPFLTSPDSRGGGDSLPSTPQWARLRARTLADRNAPLRESEPPAYRDALKAYFDAIAKSQQPGDKERK